MYSNIFFILTSVYRFCGRVVCYQCSASRHPIPPERIVQNPYDHVLANLVEPGPQRVCDTCIPVLRELSATSSHTRQLSNAIVSTVTPLTPEPPRNMQTQELTSSELDDRFLIECPVCRKDLRQFGDDDMQAIHVATCLEGHSTSPSFNGGSRHLGTAHIKWTR